MNDFDRQLKVYTVTLENGEKHEYIGISKASARLHFGLIDSFQEKYLGEVCLSDKEFDNIEIIIEDSRVLTIAGVRGYVDNKIINMEWGVPFQIQYGRLNLPNDGRYKVDYKDGIPLKIMGAKAKTKIKVSIAYDYMSKETFLKLGKYFSSNPSLMEHTIDRETQKIVKEDTTVKDRVAKAKTQAKKDSANGNIITIELEFSLYIFCMPIGFNYKDKEHQEQFTKAFSEIDNGNYQTYSYNNFKLENNEINLKHPLYHKGIKMNKKIINVSNRELIIETLESKERCEFFNDEKELRVINDYGAYNLKVIKTISINEECFETSYMSELSSKHQNEKLYPQNGSIFANQLILLSESDFDNEKQETINEILENIKYVCSDELSFTKDLTVKELYKIWYFWRDETPNINEYIEDGKLKQSITQ